MQLGQLHAFWPNSDSHSAARLPYADACRPVGPTGQSHVRSHDHLHTHLTTGARELAATDFRAWRARRRLFLHARPLTTAGDKIPGALTFPPFHRPIEFALTPSF
jgi:hypothetical protein